MSKKISRRDFMSYSALGLASLTILPSWTIPDGPQKGKKVAPSDRIVLGFIGNGQQGRSDFRSFSTCPGVEVAACCDVDSIKRERFRRDVAKWQKENGMNERCDMYEYLPATSSKGRDIDAVGDCDSGSLACPD
jgi:hypothetical protein